MNEIRKKIFSKDAYLSTCTSVSKEIEFLLWGVKRYFTFFDNTNLQTFYFLKLCPIFVDSAFTWSVFSFSLESN